MDCVPEFAHSQHHLIGYQLHVSIPLIGTEATIGVGPRSKAFANVMDRGRYGVMKVYMICKSWSLHHHAERSHDSNRGCPLPSSMPSLLPDPME